MEQKIFKLPKHPHRDEQQVILVERPAKNSVWYLVVESDKSIPLVNLENPESPKQVLDALKEQCGESAVAQFVMAGFSKEVQ